MFLFFGVLVLVVVPEKKKGRQSASKGFFMAGHIFLTLIKVILNVRKRYRNAFYFESMTCIVRALENSIDKFNMILFLIL